MAVGDVAIAEELATFGFTVEQCASLVSTFGYLCYEEPPSVAISNHCQLAIDRLIEQYKKSTDFHGLICAFVDQLQDLEFVGQDLGFLRTLSASEGVQLDGIGDIVGLDRTSADDTVYRQDIRNQIGILSSNGTPEDVINFLLLKTQATSLKFFEIFPAKIRVELSGVLANIPSGLVADTERIAPAGVGVDIDFISEGVPPFAFAPEGSLDPTAFGFAEPTIALSGGAFVEPI